MSAQVKEDDRAKQSAKSALESIVDQVFRLQHIEDCDGSDCELSDEQIYTGINLWWEAGKSPAATDEEREQYHNEDEARQSINEDPLSLQLRSGWYSPGETPEAEEFEILLCTGGPAVRIIGELGAGNEPDSTRLQYQDWFTPWVDYTDTTDEQDEALLTYCRQFYFGG